MPLPRPGSSWVDPTQRRWRGQRTAEANGCGTVIACCCSPAFSEPLPHHNGRESRATRETWQGAATSSNGIGGSSYAAPIRLSPAELSAAHALLSSSGRGYQAGSLKLRPILARWGVGAPATSPRLAREPTPRCPPARAVRAATAMLVIAGGERSTLSRCPMIS